MRPSKRGLEEKIGDREERAALTKESGMKLPMEGFSALARGCGFPKSRELFD